MGGLTQHNKMTSVSLVVGLDESDNWGRPTRGYNVRLSMNGPMQMTFDEAAHFTSAIEQAIETAKFELGEYHFGI